MPVLLTTPFNPGDMDPGQTYPRANIIFQSIRPEDEVITVQYEFGDVTSGLDWIRGSASPVRTVDFSGEDYEYLIDEAAEEEEDFKIYVGAKRVLYEKLMDKGLLDGDIE